MWAILMYRAWARREEECCDATLYARNIGGTGQVYHRLFCSAPMHETHGLVKYQARTRLSVPYR